MDKASLIRLYSVDTRTGRGYPEPMNDRHISWLQAWLQRCAGYVARDLRRPAPRVHVHLNRNILRPSYDRELNVVNVPIRMLEVKAPAFLLYSVVHLFVHELVREKCSEGGWRAVVHSDRFHAKELELLAPFGLKINYSASNSACQFVDEQGHVLCDGNGDPQ